MPELRLTKLQLGKSQLNVRSNRNQTLKYDKVALVHLVERSLFTTEIVSFYKLSTVLKRRK